MPSWLLLSIVLSVVLTVVLNVALRLFPDAGRRAGEALQRAAETPQRGEDGSGSRVRVIFPWKLMLIGSLVLTLLLNLLLRIGR